MTDQLIYNEKLSSNKTMALFMALTTLFLVLLAWRVVAGGWDFLAVLLLCFFAIFLFYSLNYRTLVVQLTAEALRLKFGVFTWRVPLDNVGSCCLDEIPALMRYGGAGIHFMLISGHYRASFNFLEYPRVVVAFKKRVGPVRNISFSTRQPDEVIGLINQNLPDTG